MNGTLPERGIGFSWIEPCHFELVGKSLHPDFIFLDAEAYCVSNLDQRLDKRDIQSYVTVAAPLRILTYMTDRDSALEAFLIDDTLVEKPFERCIHTIDDCIEHGAEAIVLQEVISDFRDENMLSYLYPMYTRICDYCTRHNIAVIYAVDADIIEDLPALARCGFSGVYVSRVEESVFSAMEQAARKNGLAVFGGIEARGVHIHEDAQLIDRMKGLVTSGVNLCAEYSTANNEEFESLCELIRSVKGDK